MKIKYIVGLVIFLTVIGIAVAQQPTMVGLQGRVTDNVGNPVNNGNLRVTVSTSDSCELGVVYDYTYNGIINGGLFNILLGNDSQLNMTYNNDYYACTWVNGQILGNAQQINRTKFRGGQGLIEASNITNGTFTANMTGAENWIFSKNVTVEGNVSAKYFVGNGTRLTGILKKWSVSSSGSTQDDSASVVVANATISASNFQSLDTLEGFVTVRDTGGTPRSLEIILTDGTNSISITSTSGYINGHGYWFKGKWDPSNNNFVYVRINDASDSASVIGGTLDTTANLSLVVKALSFADASAGTLYASSMLWRFSPEE